MTEAQNKVQKDNDMIIYDNYVIFFVLNYIYIPKQ